MRMLSARNKIRLQEPDALPFSISFPLYCSEYNQGCDGGYPYLVGKFGRDVGFVPATASAGMSARARSSPLIASRNAALEPT